MSSTKETINFATIGDIYEDGVSLIFDGQESATEKHYKCNTSVLFSPGDRVKIIHYSGTYVVEYVVGTPKQSGGGSGSEVNGIPAGGISGTSLLKNSAEDYDTSWGTPPAANSVINDYRPTNDAYRIYFSTDRNNNYYIRRGTTGSWDQISIV